MSPEERKLLEEAVNLSRENNSILRGLRNAGRWSTFFSFVKWLIIIGSTIGVYYYLQPYLDQLLTAYKNIGNLLPR